MSYLKSAPSNLSNCKFFEETKMPKFGTKNAIFGYFWPRMPYLTIFGQDFYKNYCQIWNQHPWICLIAKYREIMKMPKFGTKSALFGYFWARILKNYCHIWDQHPQICQKWVFNSYSKFQCLRISVIAKFCEETKMPKFGTKNALLGIFDQEYLI